MHRWLPWTAAAVSSVALFAAGFYWRMDAAYGPLRLSLNREDWVLLWDLFRYGQISGRVLAGSLAVGAGLAALPWLLLWWKGPLGR